MGSSQSISVFLVLCLWIQSSAYGQSPRPEAAGRSPAAAKVKTVQRETTTRFLLFAGGEAGCRIRLHSLDTLRQCGFNTSRPLVMIIHGWSPFLAEKRTQPYPRVDEEEEVDGFLESWIWHMVAALRTGLAQPVNVAVADWISLAHNHYTLAVRNTRFVGQEVAALLRWLEDSLQFSPNNVHLVGYSLGAHVSGFAGSYLGSKHKLGRITGLDPAGPMFEDAPPSDRLSPDDAKFVDAIHTFTKEHMGLSVGIKQPVAHYDFYPNGGTFQPGCHFLELYKHIANHGFNVLSQTIKCAHERSVHLFIDSLLHRDTQSMAYMCSDMDSFSQGLCLSCKKGQCNTLGYHTRQETHNKKGKKLFLVTRAESPFKVYHYQFKLQFINQIEKPIEPTFTMSLFGMKDEAQKIPITLGESIISNKTYSFLITLDSDIGEIIIIKFKWENSAVWANVWNTVQTIFPWGKETLYSGLVLTSIRIKAGETQKRMTFCSQNKNDLQLHPSQEKTFVNCEENPKNQKRTR